MGTKTKHLYVHTTRNILKTKAVIYYRRLTSLSLGIVLILSHQVNLSLIHVPQDWFSPRH